MRNAKAEGRARYGKAGGDGDRDGDGDGNGGYGKVRRTESGATTAARKLVGRVAIAAILMGQPRQEGGSVWIASAGGRLTFCSL